MDSVTITFADVMHMLGMVITVAVPIYLAAMFFLKRNNGFMERFVDEQRNLIQEQKRRQEAHDSTLAKLDKKLDDIASKLENKVDRDEYRGGIQRAHEEREKLGMVVQNHEARITELERPTIFGFVATALVSVKNAIFGSRKLI